MIYLKTNYNDFISLKLNETTATTTKINTTPIDYKKIENLKKKKSELQKLLSIEDDPQKKAELQKQAKINDLRILVAETN